MKIQSIFATVVALIVLCVGPHLKAAEPKGFLIYVEPPSTFPSACEFSVLDTGKPLYCTIIRSDGQRVQIRSDSNLSVVEYPPQIPTAETLGAAPANLETIQRLLRQYPQYRTQLLAAEDKWRNATEFAKQIAARQPKPTPQAGITLVVEGTRYDNVTLTSVESDKAGIAHSSGVAKIPLEKLTQDQVVALNTTSSSVKIDPDWAVKLQQTRESEQRRKEQADKKAAMQLQQAAADEKMQLANREKELTALRQTAAKALGIDVSELDPYIAQRQDALRNTGSGSLSPEEIMHDAVAAKQLVEDSKASGSTRNIDPNEAMDNVTKSRQMFNSSPLVSRYNAIRATAASMPDSVRSRFMPQIDAIKTQIEAGNVTASGNMMRNLISHNKEFMGVSSLENNLTEEDQAAAEGLNGVLQNGRAASVRSSVLRIFGENVRSLGISNWKEAVSIGNQAKTAKEFTSIKFWKDHGKSDAEIALLTNAGVTSLNAEKNMSKTSREQVDADFNIASRRDVNNRTE